MTGTMVGPARQKWYTTPCRYFTNCIFRDCTMDKFKKKGVLLNFVNIYCYRRVLLFQLVQLYFLSSVLFSDSGKFMMAVQCKFSVKST